MTKPKIFLVKKILLAIVVLVVAGIFNSKGQSKTYFEGQKTGNYFGGGAAISLGTGSAGISNPPMLQHSYGLAGFRYFYGGANVLIENTTIPAKLVASQDLGLLGALGAGADVYLQARNTANADLTSGTTTYFKLKEKPTLTGISVAVGGLLGVVETTSIIGQGYINATDYKLHTGLAFYNGDEGIGNPAGTTIGTKTRTIIDKDGAWYAAVTPDAKYNSVRLNVALPTDLRVASVALKLEVNVYNAFTIAAGAYDVLPQFTNAGEASGVTINTGALIGGLQLSQLVENPHYAINDDPSQYSSFSSGVASIGVANIVSQTVFYDHTASANDGVHLKLGLSNSLIGLSLAQLNGIKFYAYAGSSEVPVYTKGLGELASLLGLDLLNLINIGSSHKELELSIKPGIAFDRIKIEFDKGLLGLGVIGDALRVYDVSLQPLAPTITIQPTALAATNICEGSSASFSVKATVPSGSMAPSYQWQYSDGSEWVNTGTNSSTLTIASTTQLMNNRRFRVKVSGGNASCPQQVVSIPSTLTVSPIPSITLGTGPSECKGVTNASLAYTSATGSPNSYNITWNNSTLLPAVTNAALPSNSIILTVPPTVSAGTYDGNITVKNANGCQSPAIPFSLIIHPKIPSPHLSISSN
jgi:hypothetical protein